VLNESFKKMLLKGVLLAVYSCLLMILAKATPIVIYLQQQDPNEMDSFRSGSGPTTTIFPQARYFGDYFPKYVLSPNTASDLSATKRNIAIGRGDGFRPGK